MAAEGIPREEGGKRMTSICHYRGDRVDDLVAMHADGHIFGPDRCGDYAISLEDARNALTVGPASVARQYIEQGANARGAHYTLTDATYDPATDITTATFKPYTPPHQNIRYYGGPAEALPIVGGRGLADKDTIRGR